VEPLSLRHADDPGAVAGRLRPGRHARAPKLHRLCGASREPLLRAEQFSRWLDLEALCDGGTSDTEVARAVEVRGDLAAAARLLLSDVDERYASVGAVLRAHLFAAGRRTRRTAKFVREHPRRAYPGGTARSALCVRIWSQRGVHSVPPPPTAAAGQKADADAAAASDADLSPNGRGAWLGCHCECHWCCRHVEAPHRRTLCWMRCPQRSAAAAAARGRGHHSARRRGGCRGTAPWRWINSPGFAPLVGLRRGAAGRPALPPPHPAWRAGRGGAPPAAGHPGLC